MRGARSLPGSALARTRVRGWLLALSLLGFGSNPTNAHAATLLGVGEVAVATVSPEIPDPLLEVFVQEPASALASALGIAADDSPGTDYADNLARRRLAERARTEGGIDAVPAAVALLVDPDPNVRGPLLELLARDDLGAALAAERAEAFARVARDDPEERLRTFAVEALGRLFDPSGADQLVALLDSLPPDEAQAAANALGATPQGRERLRVLVPQRFGAQPALDDGVLGRLLAHYGRALAEDPRGGERAEERLPLVWGGRHPSGAVRAGAGQGLENLISRLLVLGQEERCLELLGRLGGEGLDELFLDYRLAWIELVRGRQPAHAFDAAQRLSAKAAPLSTLEGRRWSFYGLYTQAASLLAAGRGAEAGPLLDEAERVVRGLAAERVDLRPRLVTRSRAWSALAADYALLAGLVELMRLAIVLSDGVSPGDPAVLARARLVHELSLRAQLAAWKSRFRTGSMGLDELFDHELSPGRLVLDNAANPNWPRGAAIDLRLALGRALAGVAREELPGFVPPEVLEVPGSEVPAAVRDPLRDPVRRGLLVELVEERLVSLAEDLDDVRSRDPLDPRELFFLRARQRQLEELLDEALEDGGGERLYEQRSASDAALNLVADLRGEARAEEARELAERMLEDYRGLDHAMRQGGDWNLVRIELAVGGALTDAGRPLEAEERLQAALDRLESLEATLRSRLAELGSDPELAALLESDLRLTRAQRADALVSLAVNANVQMGDSERAMAYFERAFELAPTEFNRVLLACYNARGGRREEALAQIRRVVVGPPVYYNLACTYALLGERDLALEYLRREFEENLASEGQRKRQAGWAWKDPDLENLKDDPRFAELAGPEPAPEGEAEK